MKMNFKSKRLWMVGILLLVFISFIFIINSNSSQTSLKNEEISTLKTQSEDQLSEINEHKEQIEILNNELETKDKKLAELEEKVDEAAPWFELTEKEKQRKIEEEKEKEEAEKAAAAKKEQEEKERKEAEEAQLKKEAEEKEKKGYETGITFDEIARTPDDFVGELVKFNGRVVQVMEGDGVVQIRLNVDNDYDQTILAEFDSSIVDSRVLEDDVITIFGVSAGLYTYTSTLGGEITIPSVIIEKIEQ